MGIEIIANDLKIHAHTHTAEHHGSSDEISTNFRGWIGRHVYKCVLWNSLKKSSLVLGLVDLRKRTLYFYMGFGN